MNINIDKRVFNKSYLPYLFDYSHRHECYYGGAGSGKSHFIAQKLVLKAIKRKRKILIIRKVDKTSKDSTFQIIKDTLVFFQFYETAKVNNSELKIELPNGSLFLFKGLDDPEKIKSITGITDIWIEECTECTLNDITQLDLRLRAKVDDLQILYSFNPVSKDNWVYAYFHREPNGVVPANMMVLHTTYKDNEFLPQSYIDALLALQESNPTYYAIYVLGEFASLDKLIYSYQELEFDWREVPGIACFGLDFGYTNDPTAFSAFKVDMDKKHIYVFDEMYKYNLTNNKIAGNIISMGYAKEIITADCQEQKSIDELRHDYGIRRIRRSYKGKGSVLFGIQYLQKFKIYVHPSCKEHISEFRNYSWKKNKQTGEYINEPIDKFNHLMDAMRYGIQAVKPSGVRFNSKRSLGL